MEHDLDLMRMALDEARAALTRGEVPVGAVLAAPLSCLDAAGLDPAGVEQPFPGVFLLARGANATRADKRITAHAELVALEAAGALLGDYRIEGATVYVTLEPCLMCLGAIQQARISRVVYGATEPKFGALGSRYALAEHESMRRISFEGGVLAVEAAEIMGSFFSTLRAGGRPQGATQ
ncbi:nucleoside deaminase [bacterium]|nr:nucleoside deaminase [bacterium]